MNNLVRQENYPKLRTPTTILDHVERGVEGGGWRGTHPRHGHVASRRRSERIAQGQGCLSRPPVIPLSLAAFFRL
jgi:hypothetical protein